MAMKDRPFNERMRDRFFGRRPGGESEPADEPAGLDATPRGSGVSEMGFFGRVQRPGGFDAPPAEPVELEGPLPWELGGPRPEEDGGADPAPSGEGDGRS
ncbi:hypothetical protein DVJ78_16650 [Humibacter sp. BT305]|nr:hypothetical protein DVJ78_16650 [Humibacter sp. BT305]